VQKERENQLTFEVMVALVKGILVYTKEGAFTLTCAITTPAAILHFFLSV